MLALTDLIAPFDVKAFRADYLGKRPLHIRGIAARPEVLNWRRFNQVLALGTHWNEDSLRIYFRNRPALRDSYCDPPESAGRKALANPAKVKALISLGASVVANHIHRVCPEVAAVARMLETEFAARVFANVYCSFQGVQAFQTHYDLHDVFALHVEGEKVWRIYEARADAPIVALPPGDETERWLTQSRGRLLFEAHMKPGDVLYIPRGQYHDALTGAQASLHVTFGVAPMTGTALFKLLEKTALNESVFRSYLADASSQSELLEQLTKFSQRIKEILVSPAFAMDVLNHQRSQWATLADYELPNQRRPVWYSLAKRAQVVRRDEGYFLAFEAGELALGALQPTAEWMLQQNRFSHEGVTAQQPGVDASELSRFVEQLLEAGILTHTEMR